MTALPQTATNVIRVALTPQILLMVSKVYVPVLFPVTFLVALLSAALDRALGFEHGFLPTPANLWVAAASLVLGLVVVGVTYAELVFRGEGSPSPTAGRTMKLVRTGSYAYCRNPSIHGKLLGVLSVGFALNSFAFCFVVVPLLLAGSLAEKVYAQEPQLAALFGDEYEQYRREVPLFVPWKLFMFWRKV
jgi:protein-S-isoprenylcysteine O-methyltransferase Ste14